MKPPIFFRTDAGREMGWGHLHRSVVLAEAASKRGYEPVFWLKAGDDAAFRFVRRRFQARRLTLELDRAIPDMPTESWVVLDLPHVPIAAQSRLRDSGFRVLCIDDFGRGKFAADLILNQNPGASRKMYPGSGARLLMGPRYCLLRAPFRKPMTRRIRKIADRVLICFGGSDPRGLTEIAARSLSRNVQSVIVAGPSALVPKRIQVLRSLDAKQMRAVMLWADIGLFAMGTICWEAARMGLPALVAATSTRQKPLLKYLVERGVVGPLVRPFARAASNLLADYEARRAMSERGRKLIDGRGVDRVLHAMRV